MSLLTYIHDMNVISVTHKESADQSWMLRLTIILDI